LDGQVLSLEETAIRVPSDQIVEPATHSFEDMHPRQRPLHNPPQLTRLVVGELPRLSEELRLRYRGSTIILRVEIFGEKLR
jgi:hypothetical protein